MLQITYKQFFELSKTKPRLQKIYSQCLDSAINVARCAKEVFPDNPGPDVGELSLRGLKALAQMEGIILTGKKEIGAEYMGEILNSYGKNKIIDTE